MPDELRRLIESGAWGPDEQIDYEVDGTGAVHQRAFRAIAQDDVSFDALLPDRALPRPVRLHVEKAIGKFGADYRRLFKLMNAWEAARLRRHRLQQSGGGSLEGADQHRLAETEAQQRGLDVLVKSLKAKAYRAQKEVDAARHRTLQALNAAERLEGVCLNHAAPVRVLRPFTRNRRRGAGRPGHRRPRRSSTRAGPDDDGDPHSAEPAGDYHLAGCSPKNKPSLNLASGVLPLTGGAP